MKKTLNLFIFPVAGLLVLVSAAYGAGEQKTASAPISHMPQTHVTVSHPKTNVQVSRPTTPGTAAQQAAMSSYGSATGAANGGSYVPSYKNAKNLDNAGGKKAAAQPSAGNKNPTTGTNQPAAQNAKPSQAKPQEANATAAGQNAQMPPEIQKNLSDFQKSISALKQGK